MRLMTGDRVVLVRHGTVSFERGGFVTVRWDDGGESSEWAASLELAEEKAEPDG